VRKLKIGVLRDSRFESVPVLVADIALDGPLRSEETHKGGELVSRKVVQVSLPFYCQGQSFKKRCVVGLCGRNDIEDRGRKWSVNEGIDQESPDVSVAAAVEAS
jgi:hypothetical protein